MVYMAGNNLVIRDLTFGGLFARSDKALGTTVGLYYVGLELAWSVASRDR